MFEDLNDEIAYVIVLYDCFLEVLSANFFDSSCLSQLFSLVKHLQIVVQELVDELLQVLLNLVEHN